MDSNTQREYNRARSAEEKNKSRAESDDNSAQDRHTRDTMPRNFHQYKGKNGQIFWRYERQYAGIQLRKRGFVRKQDAERDLREAMEDLDALARGEIKCTPTTAQEALDIYKESMQIRALGKGYQYKHNVNSNSKVIEQFVEMFGRKRLIRECTEDDLRKFYHELSSRDSINQNSAGCFIGRIQGMLKAAQKRKPDLATWVRPTLKVDRTPEFERRIVEPWEYATLVRILQNPPQAPSRREDRKALWRDAADAVQLLRMTGGRLNEILRLQLWQFIWPSNVLRLDATKTENKRDLPLWAPIGEVVEQRKSDGLIDNTYLFPRARVATFDNAIARACRKAGEEAKLNYGRENGFTCHSLRHTFISAMMEATNNDIDLVMSWSGHKSLEAFKIYLHETKEGRKLGEKCTDNLADFLRTFESQQGNVSQPSHVAPFAKPLKRQKVVA